jgi:hypothetical protein
MMRTTKQKKLSETAAALSARPAPHKFWRMFPAETFDEVRRLEVACHMGIFATTDKLWRDAIAGDAACAAAVALQMKVPTKISYSVDVRMTVLLHAALRGNDGCALILSHLLSRMPIDAELRDRLATSWLTRNLHRASDVAEKQRRLARCSINAGHTGEQEHGS